MANAKALPESMGDGRFDAQLETGEIVRVEKTPGDVFVAEDGSQYVAAPAPRKGLIPA